MSYSRIANSQVLTYQWTVFGPSPTDFTLPRLPLDLVDTAPRAGDQVMSYADLYDADAVTGYDQVREHLFATLDSYRIGRAPSAGRFRESHTLPPFTGRAPQQPLIIQRTGQ